MEASILITGFEGYGGRAINPAEEVARALDGQRIGGEIACGRIVPVNYEQLRPRIQSLVKELQPKVVVCLGLWPGEPVIRVERVAVNISVFEIPDNEGALIDGPISAKGPQARMSGLPVAEIVKHLIHVGIPARASSTAGSFLCNAIMYHAIGTAETQDPAVQAGFIHLPYLPVQVADLIVALGKEATLELHQRADLPSMALDMQIDAIRAACETSLEAAG
jgi:pyroglutamyl-peptidase